jgi:uncharacterized DUF497 family protein
VNEWDLEIDPDQEAHIARHNITVEEVDDVVHSNVFIRRTRQPGTNETVYRFLGQTEAGRYLTVYVAPRRRRVLSLVTARESTPSERREFQRWRR